MLRINFLGHMLVIYTVVHFGNIILLLYSIWLELRIIMSAELSCIGLQEYMGIAFLVSMSTIVLMALELLKEN